MGTGNMLLGITPPYIDYQPFLRGEYQYSQLLHATETGLTFGGVGLPWLVNFTYLNNLTNVNCIRLN